MRRDSFWKISALWQAAQLPEINGNLIVNVKESRVAIGKDMANKIMV